MQLLIILILMIQLQAILRKSLSSLLIRFLNILFTIFLNPILFYTKAKLNSLNDFN